MIGIMALPITAAFLLARQMENTSIMGYGYCVEGMIVATSVKNDGEPRNFIILMNNFLTGFINNLP